MNEWELGIVFAVGNLAPLFTFHLLRESLSSGLTRAIYYFLMAVYFMLLFTFFIYFAESIKIRFFYLVGATFVYGAFLFLVLSEMMILGMASALTRWRGEVWAKELDYIYLLLGACGLAMSISRLDIVSEKLAFPEYIGPFVLATALAIRAIKTRVEINGWNKLRANT